MDNYDSRPLIYSPTSRGYRGLGSASEFPSTTPHLASQPRHPGYDKKGYANDPTPEEEVELKKGLVDWRAILSGKAWSVQKYIVIIGLFVLGIVLFVLYEVFHAKIIAALTPTFTKVKDLKFGWLIPIGIIFVLSFPPLFGNELVHLIVGAVWGLWIGFAIVCAGTLLGETTIFLVFKYFFRAQAEKIEKKSLYYGSLTRVIRDANFLVAVIVRLSIIPTHISTAIFATTGMSLLSFIAGAILALPKQLALVWLGAISVESAEQQKSNRQKIVNLIITVGTIAVTVFAMRFIGARVNRVKLTVLREMRSRAARLDPEAGQVTSSLFASGESASKSNPYTPDHDMHYPPPSGPPPAFSSEVSLLPREGSS